MTEAEHYCMKHPRVATAVACGKCNGFLCPRCMVFTPVGVRCADCAQLKRLPQHDVRPGRLVAAGLGALLASFLGWFAILNVFFLAWLLAVGLGFVVGDVAGRIAQRRVNRPLEVVVGAAVIVGLVVARAVVTLSTDTGPPGSPGLSPADGVFWRTVLQAQNAPISLIALIIATAVAIARLR